MRLLMICAVKMKCLLTTIFIINLCCGNHEPRFFLNLGRNKPSHQNLLQNLQSLLSSTANNPLQFFSQEVYCGPEIGSFNNCGGTCYNQGLPDCNFQGLDFFITNSVRPSRVQSLPFNNAQMLRDTNYNTSCPTVFILHGFVETANAPWVFEMQDAYFKKYKCVNIVRVGFAGLPHISFVYMFQNSELVGRRIGYFIKLLVDYGSNPNDIHVIGLSLGGIILGYIGEFLVAKHGIVIGQISGLDPAGLGNCYSRELIGGYMLNPTHAKHVMIIHTDGGNLSTGQFGCIDAYGHVDYYPNFGEVQPVCFGASAGDPICSHRAATRYFIDSINAKRHFRSFRVPDGTDFSRVESGEFFGNCNNDCGWMGDSSAISDGVGVQYLKTLGSPPYSGSQFLIEITLQEPSVMLVTISLSDKKHSTGRMKFTSTDFSSSAAKVVIGKYAPIDFSPGSAVRATITPALRIKSMAVTNEDGQRKYGSTSDVRLAYGLLPTSKVKLTDGNSK